MSKGKGKDIRPEVGGEESVNKMDNAEKKRPAIGHVATFDADYYLSLPEYKDMRFRWADYQDGSVDKLLDAGFQLVPKRSNRVNRPKGLNSREESEWVCKHVRSMNGDPMEVYLMVTTEENYAYHITDPVNKRNEEIQRAMGMGEVDADAREAGGGLKTYAANADSANASFNPIK